MISRTSLYRLSQGVSWTNTADYIAVWDRAANAVLKENQSSAETSIPTNDLDEMSKKLREGIEVDNLGMQNAKSNNKVENSEQREAQSEEERL